MRFAYLRADRPTGFRISINSVLGAVILLFPIGRRLTQYDTGKPLARITLRRGADGEFVQNEIAFFPTPWSVLGQARIGQSLEQDGGDGLEIRLGFHSHGVVNGV